MARSSRYYTDMRIVKHYNGKKDDDDEEDGSKVYTSRSTPISFIEKKGNNHRKLRSREGKVRSPVALCMRTKPKQELQQDKKNKMATVVSLRD
ncbi:hypothetical protein BLOT_003541 [Blomia tropicalis]|nr:hypothetical protein BLOT_003541 [Blomia tropicalis]